MYLVRYAGAERLRDRPKSKKQPLSDNPQIRIMQEVCVKYDVTLPRVRSREYHPKLLMARRECVTRLRNELELSWYKIGTLMWRDRKACAHLWDRANDNLG